MVFKMSSFEEKNVAPQSNGEDSLQANKKTPVMHGFHMQIQMQQPKTHKKRKREVANSLDLSSSSSSSSEEDDDTRGDSVHSKLRLRGVSPPEKVEEKEISSKEDESPQTSTSEDPAKASIKGSLHPQTQQQPEAWRVKLYRLNADGSWDDCGTGRILCLYKQQAKENATADSTGDSWIYQELGEPTLCMHSEVNTAVGATAPRILLRTRILLRDAYQRQGDNIITWCEPFLEEGNATQGVDLALSFQDNGGCLDIWRQITQVQSKAADLFRRSGGDRTSALNQEADGVETGDDTDATAAASPAGSSVADICRVVAAAHHDTLQRQEQQEMWVNAASEHLEHRNSLAEQNQQDHYFDDAYHENNSTAQSANNPQSPQLPNPPTLGNLEEIADTIAAVQVHHKTPASCLFYPIYTVPYQICISMFAAHPATRILGHIYFTK